MSDTAIRGSHISLKYLLTSERPRTLQELLINLAHGRRHAKKEFWALRDVSFEVARGESLGIIGLNGAGKSSLLKIVSGILKPTEGELEVHGRIAPLIELGAGFDLELTGAENIYLNASLLGLRKKEIDRKFGDIVEFSELEDFIYSPLKSYSSGMVARLAFSIAAEVEADILVVDEVLSVGDEGFKKKCHEKIDAFIKRGVSLFFVTHGISEIQRLCHHAMWLDRGKIHAYGNVHLVSRRYLLHFEQKAFEDIPPGHPSKKYIDAMFLHGIMNGFIVNGKRYYSPENKVSRAELAVFLCSALKNEGYRDGEQTFVDVPESHWAYRFIAELSREKLIEGYRKEDGDYFYPDESILSHELKAVLKRMFHDLDESLFPSETAPVTRGDLAEIFYRVFNLAETS
jgi:ABC-type polysaccharide/polyol phosphate transport system ATPase subunit